MPTTVVLTFDGPLGAAAARNVKNYRITDPAAQGSRSDGRSTTRRRTRSPCARSRRISIHHPYKLVIRGTGPDGLGDVASRLLDGQGTGRPGSDYATTLSWRNLILPAWYHPAKTSSSRGH